MKKLIFLLIFVTLFTTGCSFININDVDTEVLINEVIRSKKNKTNKATKGYKYYLPEGMVVLEDANNNNVLFSNGEKYYLYVDLVSYYNKKVNNYQVNEDKEAYFSKILNYDDTKGYVLVTKYNDKFFVEVMYNYAKIEAIVNNYKEAITKSLIILKNIDFNDKIINTLIGTNVLQYDEEEFDLLGPSTETIDFLQEYEDVNNEFDFDKDEEIEITD